MTIPAIDTYFPEAPFFLLSVTLITGNSFMCPVQREGAGIMFFNCK